MIDMLNDMATWSVLKWIILVLVAGFIGQFGKTMAQAVMGKIRLMKAKNRDDTGLPLTSVKKDTSPTLVKDSPGLPAGSKGIPDKKTLKILAKQQKKAMKQIKKG